MIGLAFIRTCIEHETDVYVLVRKGSRHAARLPENVRIHVVEGDLGNLSHLDISDIPKCDAFFHFGWLGTTRDQRQDTDLQEKNIQITLETISLASVLGCRTYIGAGSQAEYGPVSQLPTGPETKTEPVIAYGISKLASCRLGRIKAQALGLNFIWIRIFSIFGPCEMQGTMLRGVLPSMLRGEPCSLTLGMQKWDFLYASDAGNAFYKAGEYAESLEHESKIYCLGSGDDRTLRSYIEEMKQVLHSDSELRFGAVPYNGSVPVGIRADIHSLIKDTGWEPEVSFADGIIKEAEWLKNTSQDHYEGHLGNE